MEGDNPLIVKKILYTGSKSFVFKDGTKVKFHFQTRLCDAQKTLLDDTRKIGTGTPFELILGKNFKLEVWEAVVQCMALKEVAQFTVHKSLVMHYPFVSKVLRDQHAPHKHKKSHFCAMTLQTEGIGYDDLNEFLKTPSDLEFTIELLHAEHPEDYEKAIWQLSEAERLVLVPQLKESGNSLFKAKKYKEAEEDYAKAIGFLEQLMLKEKPHDVEWEDLNKQKMPLLLNYSQCKLTQNDYYPVIEHCTTVLEAEPDNVKALFRRGKAHIGAWNPTQAKQDLLKVLDLDPTLATAVNKELQLLEEQIKVKDEQDKKKLKNLFN